MKLVKKIALFATLGAVAPSCIVVAGNGVSNQEISKGQNKQAISPTLGGKLFTAAWMQRSAEYQALCIQSFDWAKHRLADIIAKHQGKPLAIVTDIDETIIDNSPNAVHQALKGEDYTDKSWDEWCDRADAVALAGAVKFFNYADKKGVKVFYITNRTERNRKGTMANLKKLGFPQVDDASFLFRGDTSDKTARRNEVLKNYDIALLLGDNLGDFDHLFDTSNEQERLNAVQKFENDFGHRFIVLPNPNYGTWEKAMNGGYPPLKEKDSKLKSLLKTY